MHSGLLFRRYFGADFEFLLLYLFFLGLVSVPLTSLATAFILHRGHATQFLPSDPHVGFVSGPDYRGTLNIIWVCMSTIFTCVYLSVHIDVPDKSRTKESIEAMRATPKNIAGRLIHRFLVPIWHLTAYSFCRRVFWMLFNLFAPELVVLVAFTERRSARDAVKFMRDRGQGDWDMKLAFFADMGGFQLADGTPFRSGLAFLEWFDKLQQTHEAGVVLTVDPLLEEISDRCNADLVLKLFTCLQASWLLIETSMRLAEAKAVSELEITTCAYILCTVVSYACWLQKPYSVEGRVTIRDNHIVPRDEYIFSDDPSPPSTLTSFSYSTLQASESTPSLLPLAHLSSAAMRSRKVESGESTRLPVMVFQGARFTPFNRSYLHPDFSWPRTLFYL